MSAKLKSWIFLFTRIVLGRRNAKKAFASEATPPGPDGEITTLRQTFSPLEGIPAPHFPTFLDAFGISFSAGNEPFRNVSAYGLSGHTKMTELQWVAQYNLSVESNQNVESKRQRVESEMGNFIKI